MLVPGWVTVWHVLIFMSEWWYEPSCGPNLIRLIANGYEQILSDVSIDVSDVLKLKYFYPHILFICNNKNHYDQVHCKHFTFCFILLISCLESLILHNLAIKKSSVSISPGKVNRYISRLNMVHNVFLIPWKVAIQSIIDYLVCSCKTPLISPMHYSSTYLKRNVSVLFEVV